MSVRLNAFCSTLSVVKRGETARILVVDWHSVANALDMTRRLQPLFGPTSLPPRVRRAKRAEEVDKGGV